MNELAQGSCWNACLVDGSNIIKESFHGRCGSNESEEKINVMNGFFYL